MRNTKRLLNLELTVFISTLLSIFGLGIYMYNFHDGNKLVKRYYRLQLNSHTQLWHKTYLNKLQELQPDKSYFSCTWCRLHGS